MKKLSNTSRAWHRKPLGTALTVGALWSLSAWAADGVTVNSAAANAAAAVAAPASTKTLGKKAKSISKSADKTTAEKGVVLSDIQVEGLQRSDPAAVFNIIPVKIGDYFTADSAIAVTKSLYNSGLYENVDVNLIDSVLHIKLSERAVISELKITGMKRFDKKPMLAGLKDMGFSQGQPFNPAVLEQVKAELLHKYTDDGLLAAKVTANVTKRDRNQVAVEIKVDEGKNTKVRAIRIEGNKHISTSTIRSVMELDTNGIFSWYTKDSAFSEERLKTDLENIHGYYYDRGYLDFDIVNVVVKPTTHGDNGVDLVLTLKEGEQYRVKSLTLVGDTQGTPHAAVQKLVKYRLGSVYSRTKMTDIVKSIQTRLGVDGYALAQVDVRPRLNPDHTVDVQIAVNPLERVYVRKININGNSRTSDEVIRREIRQMESALFNADQVQTSRDRIDRLGFFDNVAVDVKPVEGANNQVDVTYTVNEISTGSMQLSVGYNTSDKIVVAGTITENNFLGSGQSLSVGVDTSKATRSANVSTSNPYFTKDGISQSASVYYRKVDQSEESLSNTKYTTVGGKLVYGIPVSERHKIYLGINPEYNKVELDPDKSPMSYLKFMKDYGKDSNHFVTYGLNLGWSYDTRDSVMMPSRGQYQNLSGEIVPLGDLKYYHLSYQLQHFVPLNKRFTLAFNTQLDYGHGFSGSVYPFYDNFFAGGLGSIRGYSNGTVGPRELPNSSTANTLTSDNYVGGNKRVIANAEFQFPFPGMTKSKAARLFLYADTAGVWADNNPYVIAGSEGFRYAYGLGMLWNSPIGPLKFSYGIPFHPKAGDKEQRFQFQIGTSF